MTKKEQPQITELKNLSDLSIMQAKGVS